MGRLSSTTCPPPCSDSSRTSASTGWPTRSTGSWPTSWRRRPAEASEPTRPPAYLDRRPTGVRELIGRRLVDPVGPFSCWLGLPPIVRRYGLAPPRLPHLPHRLRRQLERSQTCIVVVDVCC